MSWLIHRGEIPPDQRVCHNCPSGDNTRCVNPAHLFLGTQAENLRDMAAKGRHGAQRNPDKFAARIRFHHKASVGEQNGGAKLSEGDVIELRRLRLAGATYGPLMKRFAISKSQVARICNHVSWARPSSCFDNVPDPDEILT
ncbi:MAG: hypothetical protein IT300_14850 [Dehalococcoidia bacterium]|nr:hypothetical protein [Dehalococcoidia bacterium]